MKLVFEDDKVISKSNDVDSKIVGNISSVYLKYTKDKNQNKYSSYSNQPISNIYCTTKLNSAIKEEQILIGKCSLSEEENILSNFYLMDISDEEYKEKFNIFNFEIDKSNKLQLPQLEVILCSIFACNLTSNDRVYIICDEEGDNYNWRAIDILQQVYKKLPYFMRKSIGYNTYSVGNDDAARIKIAITTRNNSDIEGAYVIDLESSNYYEVLLSISQKIKDIVNFLLEQDDNKLIYIYDEIYNIYGLKNLTIDKFMTVLDYVDFYGDREIDNEIVENYIYDINKANEHPEQVDLELFKKMVSDVKNKLDNKSLNNYIRYNFNNTEDLNNIDLKSLEAFKFMYYMENIYVLDIDLIENWFKQKRIPYLEKKYNTFEFLSILQKDRNLVENIQNKIVIDDEFNENKNIDSIKERAISVIDKKLYELNEEYQKYIREERNIVKDKLQNMNSLQDILDRVREIKVEYSENYEFIKQEVENKLLFIMSSYKNYLDLKNIKLNDITEEEYDNFCKDVKFYYDQDTHIVEELFNRKFIEESVESSALDTINNNFKYTISTAELIYYKNLLLNIKDLNNLGLEFNIFIKKLKYPDKNEYELQRILNSSFENQLLQDKQGINEICIDDLRNFLSENRNYLSQDNIKLGYDYMESKLYINIDDIKIEEPKLNLDSNVLNAITDTIYKVINKDINRFFRSLILVEQDSNFKSRLEKAKNNYANLEANEKAFLVFDNTLFRTAEKGFVLTDKYVYYKSSEGKIGKILISDIESIVNLEKDDLICINNVPINCEIISEKYRKEFKDLILSIFYLLQNANDENGIEELVAEVLTFQ